MVLAFKLSQKARRRLLIVMLVIIALQTLIGLSLIITSIHIIVNIAGKLHRTDELIVDKMFASLIILGIVIMVVQLVGIKVCCNCITPHLHPKCGKTLRLWLILSSVTSDLGLGIASLAPLCSRSLMQRVRNSLHRGMGQYLNDIRWKTMFDALQQEKRCCGVEHYSDWHQTSWLHAEHIRGDSQTVIHYTEVDGRILPPVVPWSCCNPNTPMPCLHDPLQQSRSHFVWHDQPEFVLQTIYTKGCLEVLSQPMDTGLSAATGILTCIFILKFVTMITARYLYTSARNAMLLGEPKGAAYGWLIGRGDFGLAKGATIEQLDLAKAKKKLAKASGRKIKVEESPEIVKVPEARRRKTKKKRSRKIPLSEDDDDRRELIEDDKASI